MELKFLYNEPAILLDKNLIIADLHLGVEAETLSRSVAIRKVRENIEKIKKLVEKFNVKRVIVTGDFKHKIPKKNKKDKRENEENGEDNEIEDNEIEKIEKSINIRKIINEMKSFVDLVIISGNHDGGIKEKVNEMVIKNVGIIHGHRWPSEKILKCSTIICSHIHPFYTIEDKFGKKRERVFLIGKFTEEFYRDYEKKFRKNIRKKIKKVSKVIIIPTFNDLVYGKDIREIDRGIFSKKRFKIVSIYLLNGIKISL